MPEIITWPESQYCIFCKHGKTLAGEGPEAICLLGHETSYECPDYEEKEEDEL